MWQSLEAGENLAFLNIWKKFTMIGELENESLRRKLEPDSKGLYEPCKGV